MAVTRDEIVAGLRRAGVEPGMDVGVHSSLSRFGHVEGGPDTVIDALIEAVGPEGTIVMPTYSTNREEHERTPEEIEAGLMWKYRVLPFDPATTPCWTGRIPEVFRRRREAVRGTDPVFSLTAIGRSAEQLSRGWDELLAAEGRILLLGVTLGNCTALHLAEKRVTFPEDLNRILTMPRWLRERYPDPAWETDFGIYPDFELMDPICRREGIMQTEQIGDATVRFLPLPPLIDLYARELTATPHRFYGLPPPHPE